MKVVAIVGMAGSGKSEVARYFVNHGFVRVRFGQVTEDEIIRRNLKLCEENERKIRESLRLQYGMAAFAKLNIPRIDSALQTSPVVADGMYSWEEYLLLKNYYDEVFSVIAVWSSPATRYQRLLNRRERPLTLEEAQSRDKSEIENINKGGPIAMANFMIVNEGPIEDLKTQVSRIMSIL